MEPVLLGAAGVAALLALLAAGLPVGAALGIVALGGLAHLAGAGAALSVLGSVPFQVAASWELTAIPMFLVMGAVATRSGMAADLFAAARLWLARVPGGLAVSATLAAAGFGAASGSSLAASAAMTRLAVPEMLRHGYDRGLAAGVVASAGTLAALIPPSVMFVLYGVFAEVSIARLLMAGLLPGLLTATLYTAMIVVRCRRDPGLAPKVAEGGACRAAVRWRATARTWPLAALMAGVLGGLYGGWLTPTEAGAAGAALAIALAFARRRLGWRGLGESLTEAVTTTAQIFFVAVGAILFTRFLALAGLGDALADAVAPWAGAPLALVAAMALAYLVLGMFLDPIGIMLITIPVFVPLGEALGLDPVWLGVLIVKFIEIGLLTPPVGFQVYVVRAAADDTLPLGTIFRGCGWFLACEVVAVGLLIAFPQISLALPNALL